MTSTCHVSSSSASGLASGMAGRGRRSVGAVDPNAASAQGCSNELDCLDAKLTERLEHPPTPQMLRRPSGRIGLVPPPQSPAVLSRQGSQHLGSHLSGLGGRSVASAVSSTAGTHTAAHGDGSAYGARAFTPSMMDEFGSERTRVASLMPPPPHGGHPNPMVSWRPGRLTQARITRAVTTGLPTKAVARLQKQLTVSTLSTGGIDATAKLAAKRKMEGAVSTSLRNLRAACERRELARLLLQIDMRLRDCTGRIIDIAMHALLAQLQSIEAMPAEDMQPIGHITHVPPPSNPRRTPRMASSDLLGSSLDSPSLDSPTASPEEEEKPHPLAYTSKWEERGLGDAKPPPSDLWRRRRGATLVVPTPLVPIRSPIVVASAAQLRPRMIIGKELVFSLYSKAIGLAVLAMQPTQRTRPQAMHRVSPNWNPTRCRCKAWP